jgi:uncharacterized membrane protein HdeD (DUF308 family)
MIYQTVGRKRPIIQIALGALNYLLAAVGICLLLSGCCCGVGAFSGERTHRRWLRLTMIFFACALLLMAAVVAITVIFRLWYTKVIG